MARKKDYEEDVEKENIILEEMYFFICYKFKARPDRNKDDIPQDLKEENGINVAKKKQSVF